MPRYPTPIPLLPADAELHLLTSSRAMAMAVVANGPVNPDTCGCSRLPCASLDVARAADPTPSKTNGIGSSTKGLGSAALGTATQNRGSGSNPSTQPHNNLTTQLEELMGEVRRLHDVVRGYNLHEP